jgi:hypothetical protein
VLDHCGAAPSSRIETFGRPPVDHGDAHLLAFLAALDRPGCDLEAASADKTASETMFCAGPRRARDCVANTIARALIMEVLAHHQLRRSMSACTWALLRS